MEKSQTIKGIAKALTIFHLKVGKIKRDATNPFFKSKYATLSNILDAIGDPLAEAGLSFAQFPCGENGLTTVLMHSDTGEYIEANYEMKPVKDDPQGRGSAITYQRRYALAAILGLNIDDDDDANTATHGGPSPDKIEQEKPWLNDDTDEFRGAVEKMKAGKSSIPALRNYFKISKAIEQKLLDAVKQ